MKPTEFFGELPAKALFMRKARRCRLGGVFWGVPTVLRRGNSLNRLQFAYLCGNRRFVGKKASSRWIYFCGDTGAQKKRGNTQNEYFRAETVILEYQARERVCYCDGNGGGLRGGFAVFQTINGRRI